MGKFYTTVATNKDDILTIGYDNGVRFQKSLKFKPSFYINSKSNESHYKTLQGSPVNEIIMDSISEAREYYKNYKNVNDFTVYGNDNYIQQFISDEYQGEVIPNFDDINVVSIDIETTTNGGWKSIKDYNESISLITMANVRTKKIVTFGVSTFGIYKSKDGNATYYEYDSEARLLTEFLLYWRSNFPDVITGWNTDRFDIPYIVKRLDIVLGDKKHKKLSPWDIVREKNSIDKTTKKAKLTYDIVGISHLDYIDLYKKFTYVKQESYSLDYICEVELGEHKLKNPGSTFKEFYTDHWDTFVDYNIRDSVLVCNLEHKLKLINTAMVLAYYAKINYIDVFSPVKMWDAIIYNHLRSKNIVIPPNNNHTEKSEKYEGAYVKAPIVGFHKNVVSYDLASLYPHIMMLLNISPETILDEKYNVNVDGFLHKEYNLDELKSKDIALAANGWTYRRDIRGFLSELMDDLYNKRQFYKVKMLEFEKLNDKSYSNEIAYLDVLQMALKIALNSAYGAVGQENFRYYDVRMAESVTMTGQLVIRFIADRINGLLNAGNHTTDVEYVIYIDTDSNYISLESIINKICTTVDVESQIDIMDKFCKDVLTPYIDKNLNDISDYLNAYDKKLSMKREALADKALFIAKKRYILNVHDSEGVRYKTPKLKVMGLEMIKSTTPSVIRTKLKSIIPTILNGDLAALKLDIDDYRKLFYNMEVKDIARTTSVNGLETYSSNTIYTKGTPIHVRAGLLHNHYIKRLKLDDVIEPIRDGDKIKYVYLKMPNQFKEDVMGFSTEPPSEFKVELCVDYEKQFDKVFLGAIRNMVEPLNWNIDNYAELGDDFL